MQTSSPLPRRRALVLGGGGAIGNAWLIGVLAGLHDAGLDVTDADPIVGTSAGATAAVQITNAPLPDLVAAALEPVPAPAGGGRPPEGGLLERTQQVIDASADAAEMRRRMGALLIELSTDGGDRWRQVVAARLPGHTWSDRRVLLTAVDAESGDPVVLDPTSGVDVVDAVAASTAGGAAFRIGARWYFDGGYRRNENADLAAGAARVLVLSPFGGRTRHPLPWRMQLAAQVEDLRAGGSRVEVIGPDRASLEAFGDSMMDLTRRPAAARAGFAQGRFMSEALSAFWAT